MKARYVDVPYGKLEHVLYWPEMWERIRGTTVHIGAPVSGVDPVCDGPHFPVIGSPATACAHIIELDESDLFAEVEAVAREMQLEVTR